MNLDNIFKAKSVAIIGASTNKNKIGHIILKNFIDGGYQGQIYPINLHTDEILGLKAYNSINEINNVESVVIAIPAKYVPQTLEDCGKKGVKGVVLISGGFKEIGNKKLEDEVLNIAKKYNMTLIGPNVVGVLDARSKIDSIFFPYNKMERPKPGNVSIISQSGAVGGCLLDMLINENIGIAKFISYGNAAMVDATVALEYLAEDLETKVILVYLEGVKNGKKFMEVLNKINKKKPVIALKSGVSVKGQSAAASHTGTMAGSSQAYEAAFKQTNTIQARTFNELFNYAKVMQLSEPKGKNVCIITNGGGNGVLTTDALEKHGLNLADYSEENKQKLKDMLPHYAQVGNPEDLIGDAPPERYKETLEILINDDNIDMFIIIILFQTVSMNEKIINYLNTFKQKTNKPMIAITSGGKYTQELAKQLNKNNIPTYDSPDNAVGALSKLYQYHKNNSNNYSLGIKD